MSLKYSSFPASLPEVFPNVFTFAGGQFDGASPRLTSFDNHVSSRRKPRLPVALMKRKGSVGNVGKAKGSAFLGYLQVTAELEEVVDYGAPLKSKGTLEQVSFGETVSSNAKYAHCNHPRTAKSPKAASKGDLNLGRPLTKATQESSQAMNADTSAQHNYSSKPFSIDDLISESHHHQPQQGALKAENVKIYSKKNSQTVESGPFERITQDTVFMRSQESQFAPQTQSVYMVHGVEPPHPQTPNTPSIGSKSHEGTRKTPNTRVCPAAEWQGSRSRSVSKSSVISRKMDQLARQGYSKKVRAEAAHKNSTVPSKVSMMLSCPAFYQNYSKKRSSSYTPDPNPAFRQSFVTSKSRKMLSSRPQMDIADLLLQKGKILDMKKEEMVRKSLPLFRPNPAKPPKTAGKASPKDRNTLDVFERLAVSTFLKESREKSSEIIARKRSVNVPCSAGTVLKGSTAVKRANHPSSFECLNKITLRSSGLNSFFVFEAKPPLIAQPDQRPSPAAPVPPNPTTISKVYPSGDAIYQKNKYWLMKREGKAGSNSPGKRGKGSRRVHLPAPADQESAPERLPAHPQIQQGKPRSAWPPQIRLEVSESYVGDILKSALLLSRQ